MGIGEAMALGSAATWAVGVILARQLGVHLPPLALNLLKNGLVLAVLALVALVLALAVVGVLVAHHRSVL